jgi:MerR family mercuric resistance operon transcriptional regulator
VNELKRLAFIRRARDLGFSLNEVRALLRPADNRGRTCAEVRDLAAGHLSNVRAKIADLKKMRRILREMVLQCADGTLPECPLIESLSILPE